MCVAWFEPSIGAGWILLTTRDVRKENRFDARGTNYNGLINEETALRTGPLGRPGYLKRIEEYADHLAKAKNKKDEEELERVFEQEMRDDFNLLKDELKDEAKKVIFSKEMAVAAIALAGTSIAPQAGLEIAGGALYLKKIEYRAARNKVLKSHPMSWLYSTKRLPIF